MNLKKQKPVKLAIIGCGIAARRHHWPALQRLQDKFRVTVVCNRSEPKAREFRELAGGVPYVLDYREVLERHDVEAVDIILPFHLNPEVTLAALQAGKHVLVEKPLAANPAQAEKLLQAAAPYSQVKMVAENFYYHPVFVRARELLGQDPQDMPYAVFWDIFRELAADNPYLHTKWRMSEPYPGGFILDGGVHNIAALHMLFGDLQPLHSWARSVNPALGAVDSFSVQFRGTARLFGMLNLFVNVQGYSRNCLTILTATRTIRVEDCRRLYVHSGDQKILEETFDTKDSYYQELLAFYQAVRDGREVYSTFERAAGDLRFLYHAIQSGKTG